MVNAMSYALGMGIGISSDEAAEIYLDKLFEGLIDIGFVEDDIQIEKVESECDVVMSLWLMNARIASGVGEDEFEAANELLDRAADLFFVETPEV